MVSTEANDLAVEVLGLNLPPPLVEVMPDRGSIRELPRDRCAVREVGCPQISDMFLERAGAWRPFEGNAGLLNDAHALLQHVGHPTPYLRVRLRLLNGE